jgi:polyphenol oxidase
MIRELHGTVPAGTPAGAGVWRVWMSDLLAEQPGLIHAMTLSDRNMSLTSGGPAAAAVEQRRGLCGVLGLPFEQLTVAQQVHGCEVVPVDDALAGRGRADHGEAIGYVDGLHTQAVRRPLLSLSADCPAVVVYDPDARAVGVAHAGWRGTFAGIAARLVEGLRARTGTPPQRLLAAIAPSAGPCCYEVQDDVLRIARTRWPDPEQWVRRSAGRAYLDLWSANAGQLQAAGVPAERIDVAGLCTICDGRFCSYRREGRSTRHAGLVAALRG